jgi:hypothetical protein
MVSGKVRIGEDIRSGWIDKTAEAIERAKRRSSSPRPYRGALMPRLEPTRNQ